ncbi:hypothetical protein SSAmo_0150 [Enterobacterales bacterium endosymbiont of Anomoneura mori]|uniref:hypothetical protein n=1 Tax=Enterobacterales bacterium endosymbiont of Anomoneura mori TaxID=3132096 RepID=UPI00399CF4A7
MYNLLIYIFLIISFIINILIIFQKPSNDKSNILNNCKNNTNKIIIFLTIIFFLLNLLISNINIKKFEKHKTYQNNEKIINLNNK